MPDSAPAAAKDRPSAGAELAAQIRHAAGGRQKTRNLKPLARLWPYLMRQKRNLALMLVFLIVSSAASLGLTGAAPDRARCARQRDQIQPAVDAGQAGLVLEAWLALRACASPQAPNDGWTRRLTTGGYVPAHAALFADVPTPSLKGRRPS